MNKIWTNRNLKVINFIIVTYFILMYLIDLFKMDFFLAGFFRELFTIPFLIAQIVFLIIGIKFIMKNQTHIVTKISIFLLGICAVITMGSFF